MRYNQIDPNYTYPRDIFQTLVKDDKTGKWHYLGTIVNMMRSRREDKAMMSANNFRKNHAHK